MVHVLAVLLAFFNSTNYNLFCFVTVVEPFVAAAASMLSSTSSERGLPVHAKEVNFKASLYVVVKLNHL